MTITSDLHVDAALADDSTPGATRRAVLKTGAAALGAGATGLGGLRALAQDAASPEATPEANCVLTAELTEGPYFLDGSLIRRDITEGRPGVPLRLRILVNDPTACAPVVDAAVYLWHCDAQGFYSGVDANQPGGDTTAEEVAEAAEASWLRGIQITDADGIVEFDTIYPGWYQGRTVHIHMRVAVDGAEGTTYEGGSIAHTGQLFFDEAVSNDVYATEAYAGRDDAQRLLNAEDGILADHEDEPGFMVEVSQLSEGAIEGGLLGLVSVGVDPSATPSAAGGGMGGPGGGPGDGGPPPQG